jgi:hypothetical protein
VIPPEALTVLPGQAPVATHVVYHSTAQDSSSATLIRYPADVTGQTGEHLDEAFLVVHEDHARQGLLDQAAIILVTPGETLRDALDRHPGAALAAAAEPEGCVARTRQGTQIRLRAEDLVAAVSLLYNWLILERPLGTLPTRTTITAGPLQIGVEVVSVVSELVR